MCVQLTVTRACRRDGHAFGSLSTVNSRICRSQNESKNQKRGRIDIGGHQTVSADSSHRMGSLWINKCVLTGPIIIRKIEGRTEKNSRHRHPSFRSDGHKRGDIFFEKRSASVALCLLTVCRSRIFRGWPKIEIPRSDDYFENRDVKSCHFKTEASRATGQGRRVGK